MMSCSTNTHLKSANHVGLFLIALYALCWVWYFVHPVEQELHLKMWQMSFWGFEGTNVMSFVLGAIQTYVMGYILVGLWCLTGCCSCCKKGGEAAK